jgi:GTPase SAR1 family protein
LGNLDKSTHQLIADFLYENPDGKWKAGVWYPKKRLMVKPLEMPSSEALLRIPDLLGQTVIVTVGAAGVGKSAMTAHFTATRERSDIATVLKRSSLETAFDDVLLSYNDEGRDGTHPRGVDAVVGSSAYQIVIYDRSSSDDLDFSCLFDQCARDGKGFLLVYSVTDKSSFDEITQLKLKILRNKEEDQFPM